MARLEFIPVTAINVDPTYQRRTDAARVKRIAAALDEGAMKAISVSERPDGSLWVYDGAHTVAAARLAGMSRVPALIVRGTREQEARWFLAINGGSKRVSQRDTQHAGVAASDAVAVLVDRLMSAHGLTVQSGGQARPGKTNAVGLLRTLAKRDPAGLEAAMGVIGGLWPSEPLAWSGRVISGVHGAIAKAGADAVRAGLKARKVTPQRIEDGIAVLGKVAGGSGWSAAASVVISLAGV